MRGCLPLLPIPGLGIRQAPFRTCEGMFFLPSFGYPHDGVFQPRPMEEAHEGAVRAQLQKCGRTDPRLGIIADRTVVRRLVSAYIHG
jgi:hypothetical protein